MKDWIVTEEESTMPTAHVLPAEKPSRVKALKAKHTALSTRIEELQKRPFTADYYLRQLKKQKLRIKEKIEGIDRISASG